MTGTFYLATIKCINMAEADDPFDEDGDIKYFEEVTWEKMKSARLKDGFSDGKLKGEDKTLQEGFNVGYVEGFQYNFPVAVIRGIIGALQSYLKKTDSPYWQRIQEVTSELTQFEQKFLEMRKLAIAASDINEESTSDEITDVDPDKIVCSSLHENNKNNSATTEDMALKQVVESRNKSRIKYNDDIKTFIKHFHSIKDKSVALLEECGFSKLSQLINDVLI